jgi:alkylhydroperoxidase/carboxymuconolactone decarboxylase family protein YurZ
MLGSMEGKAPVALNNCTAFVAQVEQIKTRYMAMQEAVAAHMAGLESVLPELETKNPPVAKILKVTQTGMTKNLKPTLSHVTDSLARIADAAAATGSALGLLGNATLPALKAQFQRLAGFSELAIALKEKNIKAPELPGKLGPLYQLAVDGYNLSTPPLDQVQKAYNDLKQEMTANVQVIQDVLRRNHADRTLAVQQIISLS